MKARAMMAMATTVVHSVEVLLEAMAVVVWLAKVTARGCVITATKLGIWLTTIGTRLRHVGIAEP